MDRSEINARLTRMNIRGNDYVTVNQRVQGFWEVCPEGRIETKWLVLEKDYAVCQATISVMDVVVSQGTAMEVQTKSGVNSTSFLENCETSAVGRALGLFGIGSVESIASADEVGHAIALQEQKEQEPPAPDRNTMGRLFKQIKTAGINTADVTAALQAMGLPEKSEDYTTENYATACAYLEQVLAG